MVEPALQDPVVPARWTAEQYLRLVDEGVLGPDDRVELLEGVIVSMAPQNVPHAAAVARANVNLRDGCVELRRIRNRRAAATETSRSAGAAT